MCNEDGLNEREMETGREREREKGGGGRKRESMFYLITRQNFKQKTGFTKFFISTKRALMCRCFYSSLLH